MSEEYGIESLVKKTSDGSLHRVLAGDLSALGVAAVGHTHLYAGSASAGGPANSALEVAWTGITGKPSTFPPSIHAHAWESITGKPATFPPADHEQSWDTITGTDNLEYLKVTTARGSVDTNSVQRRVSENVIIGATHYLFNKNFFEGVKFSSTISASTTANHVVVTTRIPYNDTAARPEEANNTPYSYVLFCKGYSQADPRKIIDFRLSFTTGNGSITNTELITNGTIVATSAQIGTYSDSNVTNCIAFVINFDPVASPNFRIDVLAQESLDSFYDGWGINYDAAYAGLNNVDIVPTSHVADHTHPYAPISHAASATTYGRATSTLHGHAKLGTSAPLVAGATASYGTDNGTYSAPDHVHPLQPWVERSNRLDYPFKLSIQGAATAESEWVDGTGDVFLDVKRLDPYALDVAVPIAKGGTGAVTAAAALAALGGAASGHTHPYLALSGGTVTGTITFSGATPIHKNGWSGIPRFVDGDLSLSNGLIGPSDLSGVRYTVTRIIHGAEDSSATPTVIAHTAGTNTVVHIIDSGLSAYNRYIQLPTPATEGDQIDVIFTNKTPGYTGKIYCTCSTANRIKNLYGQTLNDGSCYWGSGEKVTFLASRMTADSDICWRAIKMAESIMS